MVSTNSPTVTKAAKKKAPKWSIGQAGPEGQTSALLDNIRPVTPQLRYLLGLVPLGTITDNIMNNMLSDWSGYGGAPKRVTPGYSPGIDDRSKCLKLVELRRENSPIGRGEGHQERENWWIETLYLTDNGLLVIMTMRLSAQRIHRGRPMSRISSLSFNVATHGDLQAHFRRDPKLARKALRELKKAFNTTVDKKEGYLDSLKSAQAKLAEFGEHQGW